MCIVCTYDETTDVSKISVLHCCSNVSVIPDTFVNLTLLSCDNINITSIPDNQYEYIKTENCKWLKRNYTTLLWNKRIRKISILQRLWKWKKVYKKVPLCRDLREYVVKKYYINIK